MSVHMVCSLLTECFVAFLAIVVLAYPDGRYHGDVTGTQGPFVVMVAMSWQKSKSFETWFAVIRNYGRLHQIAE